uniref:Uncharacterized protein n=1 Tax=Setaria digitata TaxID=48799 RepID=A0A915PZF0_9BILA
MVNCDGADFERIPTIWETTIRVLHIKNSSLLIIQKGALKRYTDLEELIIENCNRLHAIEKFAFKGLNHLKLLRLANNPSLTEIAKNAFSQVSSRHGLRIQLLNNSFSRIRQGLFRQLSRLREFTLEGQDLKIELNAFAGLTQVDFFNLFGVISFGLRPFENVSRIHRLEISRSHFSISHGIFAGISHVREIHITGNDIETIGTAGFTGLYTVGCLTVNDNKIGNISRHAFSSIVNVGEIVIERNNIRHLETEALLSQASRIGFRDNILYCSCVISWLKYINDSVLLKENFCGAEEFYRSLSNYRPSCSRPKRGQSAAVATRTHHFIATLCLFIVTF